MAKTGDKGSEKTNVMRLLDQAGIPYVPHFYDPELTAGTEAAAALGRSPECLFKTLVTVSGTGEHFVFVIPANGSLDLKRPPGPPGPSPSPCSGRRICSPSPGMSTGAALRWG